MFPPPTPVSRLPPHGMAHSPIAPTADTMLVSKKPINFIRGWPAPSLLPASLLSTACSRILVDRAEYMPILEYGADEGYQPLRENLAKWLGHHYRVSAASNRICITGGASQSLACILQSFTDVNYTRAVWMVAPCYHLVARIFEDAGFEGRLKSAPEDDDGLDVGILERRIQALEEEEKSKVIGPPYKPPHPKRKLYKHVIYCVPTCSNPSGKTMPVERREALVKLARKYNALIICDDVYDFIQWPISDPVTPERPAALRLPRLSDIDIAMGQSENDPQAFGNAVSNGSFSKISGPGVRTGWVHGSPAFASGLASTGSSKSGGAPSQLCAAMLSNLIETGELEAFIESTTRPALQRRHGILMDAVRKYLGPHGLVARGASLDGEDTYGGYFVWIKVGPDFSADLIADVAQREDNLVIGHGNMFAVRGDEQFASFDDYIRLCFAWEAEEDLVDGVRRLGRILAKMGENKDCYQSLETKARGPKDMTKHV